VLCFMKVLKFRACTPLSMLAATKNLREKSERRDKLPALSLVMIPAEMQCLEKYLGAQDIRYSLRRSCAEKIGEPAGRVPKLRRAVCPQGLNHEWPPHGQLFGIVPATFFTESRRHLARGAQLNRPFVAARRFSIIYGTTKVVP
jgi:hypothetical protein